MTTPDWYAVIDGTWPAATYREEDPWTFREGRGGGSRVSATTADGPVTDADIDRAEEAMLAMDQKLIFQIREGQEDFDRMLAARG